MLYDGHGSHLKYQAVRSAMEDEVIIIALPPHTSHSLQPLDAGLFKTFKTQWWKILLRFFREIRMKSVDKMIFPSLLKQLIAVDNSKYLVSGFHDSGLWRVDESVVQTKLTDGGEVDNENDLQLGESSPHKKLCLAIINAIAPTPTEETETALKKLKEKTQTSPSPTR